MSKSYDRMMKGRRIAFSCDKSAGINTSTDKTGLCLRYRRNDANKKKATRMCESEYTQYTTSAFVGLHANNKDEKAEINRLLVMCRIIKKARTDTNEFNSRLLINFKTKRRQRTLPNS